MGDEHTLLLGEIKGKVEAMDSKISDMQATTCSINERLLKLETQGAKHGAIAGGFVAVGIALLIEKMKKGMGL